MAQSRAETIYRCFSHTRNVPFLFGGKMKEMICAYCKKKYWKKPSAVKNNKHNFCSRYCMFSFIKSTEMWKTGKIKTCIICKKKFYAQICNLRIRKSVVCSLECKHKLITKKYSGKNSWNWKGGKREVDGYVWIHKRNHPRNFNGYVKRAVLVAEKKLKRYLLPGELTHHLNGKKDDDRKENIAVMFRGKHNSIHFKGVKRNV